MLKWNKGTQQGRRTQECLHRFVPAVRRVSNRVDNPERTPAQRVPSTHCDQSLQHLTELVKVEALSVGGGKRKLVAAGRDDRPMSPDMAQGLSAAVKDHSFGDRANSTWEIARPTAGSTIDVGHVRRAEEEIEDRMTGLFRTRLTRVTPEQQRFLAAMPAVGDGPAGRAAIAAKLGVVTTAVSRPREQLIDGGYIEAAGRGKLRLTIPGFEAYIGANS